MRWRTIFLTCFMLTAVSLALTVVSQARGLSFARCSTKQRPQAQLRCGGLNVHYGASTLRFLHNHPLAGTWKSRHKLHKTSAFLIRYGNKHTEHALSRLISHRVGWECIHSREGDWQDGGWPFWGGLQMGSWFLSTYMGINSPSGVSGPNGWYNAPSPEQQMRAAENGYKRSGYSSSWLASQWPNTYPPCTGYF